ncbi:hypothetical protein ACHZ98_11290 [Streptomyces sp. MAR4 CNY-716]
MAPRRFPRRAAVLLLAMLTVVAAGGPAETPPRGQQHRAAVPFRHPGVLVGSAQLRAVRARVNDGDRPFRAFRATRRSRYGRLSCVPHPVPVVECPPDTTYDGRPRAGVRRFERLLRDACLPEVTGAVPDYKGNWDLAMTDAATGIAVFLDDRLAYDEALRRFRARVPAYFYVHADGPWPKPPPGGEIDTAEEITTHWFGQRAPPEGLAQEACRNLMHVGYALAATAHIAETARLQGTDLYAEVQPRITAALELHSRYRLGERPPASLCGGRVERTMGPDLEVAYHHYHDRRGVDLPQTARLLARQRPGGADDLFVAWETLTRAAGPG